MHFSDEIPRETAFGETVFEDAFVKFMVIAVRLEHAVSEVETTT